MNVSHEKEKKITQIEMKSNFFKSLYQIAYHFLFFRYLKMQIFNMKNECWYDWMLIQYI